jgi:hypothetical protein
MCFQHNCLLNGLCVVSVMSAFLATVFERVMCYVFKKKYLWITEMQIRYKYGFPKFITSGSGFQKFKFGFWFRVQNYLKIQFLGSGLFALLTDSSNIFHIHHNVFREDKIGI